MFTGLVPFHGRMRGGGKPTALWPACRDRMAPFAVLEARDAPSSFPPERTPHAFAAFESPVGARPASGGRGGRGPDGMVSGGKRSQGLRRRTRRQHQARRQGQRPARLDRALEGIRDVDAVVRRGKLSEAHCEAGGSFEIFNSRTKRTEVYPRRPSD